MCQSLFLDAMRPLLYILYFLSRHLSVTNKETLGTRGLGVQVRAIRARLINEIQYLLH